MRHARRFSFLALALVAGADHAVAQVLLHDVAAPGGGVGAKSAEFDLNSDGRGDFIYNGRVFSGADASVMLDLRQVVGGSNIDVDVVGDLALSNDGVVDFVGTNLQPLAPRVLAISGLDGSVLADRALGGFGEYATFVRGVGDADGDGFGDVVAGTQWFEGPCNFEMGQVAFIAGGGEGFNPWRFNTTTSVPGSYYWGTPLGDLNGDGKTNFGIRGNCGRSQVAYTAQAGGPYSQLYFLSVGNTPLYSEDNIASVGDFDGNGSDDFALLQTTVSDPERVVIVSGLNQQVFRVFDNAGTRLAGPGDLDCDGVPDLLVSGPFGGSGSTRLYSGKDQSVLWTAPSVAVAVHRLGDIDGDGLPDMGLDLGSSLQIWSAAGLAGRPCKKARSNDPKGPLTLR